MLRVDIAFQALHQRIRELNLAPGAKLPSVRGLAQELGFSVPTVLEAYARLVADGIASSKPGSGYYLNHLVSKPDAGARRPVGITASSAAAPSPSTAHAPAPTQLPSAALDSDWLLRRAFEPMPYSILAGCGWLPEDWLDEAGLRAAMRTLARAPAVSLLRYGTPAGHAGLRRQLSAQLSRRGLLVPAEQIITTEGATVALDLVIRSLVEPGQAVLIDDPGYCNWRPMLEAARAQIVPVRRLADGLDADHLAEQAQRYQPALLITNSNCQNPTGAGLSPARAHQTLRLAEQFGVMILEDDIFAELAEPAAISLACLDQLQRVIQVGSMSKVIAPSLRVGWIAAPAALTEKLLHQKMAAGLTSSELNERLAAEVMTHRSHLTHVARLRKRLSQQRPVVVSQLLAAGLQASYDGSGMFIWARLPAQRHIGAMTDIISAAARAGIMLAPGHLFSTAEHADEWLRFNVAHCDKPELFKFLSSL